jgi:hypothetical protein
VDQYEDKEDKSASLRVGSRASSSGLDVWFIICSCNDRSTSLGILRLVLFLGRSIALAPNVRSRQCLHLVFALLFVVNSQEVVSGGTDR